MHPEIPPVAADSNASEGQRTREKRTVTTLLLGRVVNDDGGDGLCRVRNLSTGGMMFEARRNFTVGDHILVELRNGHSLSGTVVWARDGRNGVAFDEVISDEALGSLDKVAPGTKARAPRFDAYLPTRVTVDGRPHAVILENISQSGAMLRTADPRAITATVILTIPQLGARLCDRRWIRGETVGLSFAQMLRYEDLASWLELRPARGATN